jgi:2OG-Fe(II) oxygenase superfamily
MQIETSLVKALTTMESALSNVQLVSKPFPHFAIPDVFDPETAKAILTWLDNDVSWAVESRRFYVLHGCSELTESVGETPAAVIGAPETLQCMRRHLERIFGITLSSTRYDLQAHRMLPGHRIGIHTDTPRYGSETHRFLINLNAGFEDEYGGHLVLFDPDDPADSAVMVRPVHNSAVAMEFSDDSWHCVDEIRSGKRYSLVYSFWNEGFKPETAQTETAGAGDKSSAVTDQKLRKIIVLLRELGADAIPHSSRSLLDHLIGTYEILNQWHCDSDVCKAGLFHSVFGTRSSPQALVADDYHDTIRNLIGERALLLVRMFSRMDLSSPAGIVAGNKFADSDGPVRVTINDQRALVCLVWANVLEQSHFVSNSEEMIAELKHLFRDTNHLLSTQAREDICSLLSMSPEQLR